LTRDKRLDILGRKIQDISRSRACDLLGISRQSLYYEPIDHSDDKPTMDAIDETFTKYPFYGVPKMRAALEREYGITAGIDRVRRLMRLMGLMAIYPKPNLSKPCPISQTYPYLLRNIAIIRPNQVWAADITYIKLAQGWCYLIAIIDWYSRYVLSWRLSESLHLPFCLDALNEAIGTYGTPEIFNSDQGSHFTALEWIAILKEHDIRISMDGRGRCMDNIFTERFWRSLKYENVYIKGYANLNEAHRGIAEYMPFFNTIRPHESLGYQTPQEIHFSLPKAKKQSATIAQERRNEGETTIGSSQTLESETVSAETKKQRSFFEEIAVTANRQTLTHYQLEIHS
jgi:putative transposase